MEEDNLTPEEETQLEDGATATGEEEHRYGEFEDLRDRLEALSAAVSDGFDSIRTAIGAISVNSTVTDADVDDDGDVDASDVEAMEALDKLDLDDLDFTV